MLIPLIFNMQRFINKLEKEDLYFIFFGIFLIISLLITPANIFIAFASLKDFAMIIMIYFLGILSYKNNVFAGYKINSNINAVAACLLLSGLIGIILSSNDWAFININEYFSKRFEGAFFVSRLSETSLPAGFGTYINDERYLRNVSTLLDAPGYSRALSWFVIFYGFKTIIDLKKGKFTLSILFFISLFAMQLSTIGRGGIFITIMSLLVLMPYLLNLKLKSGIRNFFIVIVGIILIFLDLSSDATFVRHLDGLIYGFSDITFLGNGLGTAGQQVANYGRESITGYFARESFLGGVVAQLGLVGLFFIIVIFYNIFKNTTDGLKNFKNSPNIVNHLFVISSVSLLFTMISSLLANSAVSYFSIAIPLYFYAATFKNKSNYNKGSLND